MELPTPQLALDYCVLVETACKFGLCDLHVNLSNVSVTYNITSCSVPAPEVKNAKASISETHSTYTCVPGFQLERGDNTLLCLGSSWNGTVPICKETEKRRGCTCLNNGILKYNKEQNYFIPSAKFLNTPKPMLILH